MALPNPFQKLKHGVLLCKRNFGTFVETFNFLVDFAQNIKGDGDANTNGIIVLDRTVPDRPIIRAKVNYDYLFSQFKYVDSGRFKIASKDSSTITLENCYYRVGGRTYLMSSSSATVSDACILAVLVGLTGSQPSASFQTYDTFSELNAAECDTNYYIMPLYEFDRDLNVVCDFRIGPDAAAWEFAS